MVNIIAYSNIPKFSRYNDVFGPIDYLYILTMVWISLRIFFKVYVIVKCYFLGNVIVSSRLRFAT